MNDPTRRAIRTLVQVGLVQGVLQLWNAFAPTKLTVDQAAAITLVATPLVGFIQNMLEDSAGMPALLKAPASSGQNPVPEP
jgi:hypothetical protein